MIPILDLKRQYNQIGEEIEKEVIEVLRSGYYILGKHNKELEAELSEYVGVKHAVALNSGTDALHLALRALDIGAGDEVISVAFTFVATTEAIGIVGAKPVFVDIDPDTFNIDVEKIENAIRFYGNEQYEIHISAQKDNNNWIFKVESYPNTSTGLSICQKIVKNHNGLMCIKSDKIKGSKLIFTLPI